MKISKLNCTACGAPMSIPEDLDQITCASCGTGLVIERGEGYVALKLAEKIARTIEVSGIQTQDVIRENTQVTRTELQRLQLSQELSALQMQLNGIQTEIRLLQRDPNNKKFNSQLVSLRGNEYQAMERIRVLKRQISVPDTENLRACIEVAEWECSWIGPELAALKSSNQPQKGRLLSELENRKNELNISIHGLKIREVRNRFVSFKRPDAPEADFAQTSALLAMINEDERKLHQLRNTPEGKAVHDEILRRQKAVKQTLNRLELERLSGTLRSVNLRPDPNDRTALVDYLNQLNSDIQSLSQVNSNDSARDFRSRLVSARKSTMRQLQILDNASRKANNPGCVAALFMGIAAGFTGLMAGIAQLFKTPSSQPGDTGLIQKSKLKPIRMATTLSVDSPPTTQGQNDGKVFIGLGCFFWLLTFLGISAIGFVVFGLINDATASVDFAIMVFLLVVTIGFLLGSRTFLRRTASTITINGVGGLPDIIIQPKKPGQGIQSLSAVKTWVGIITATSVFAIFFSISTIFSGMQTGIGVLFSVVGLVLGPMAARQVTKRTSLSSLDGLE